MPDQKVSSIFSWWNTSLDPIRGANSTSASMVEKQILKLCAAFDIVILGEYSNIHDLDLKLEELNTLFKQDSISKEMHLIDLNQQGGHIKFKNLVIYNSLLYSYIPSYEDESSTFIDVSSGFCETNYRVGQRIRFSSPLFQKTLEFYIIHWSMHGEQAGDDKKISAAMTLYNEIMKHKEFFQICIGDFNTEPYSRPLCHLGSSRSKEYVEKYGGFYNPFWKEMHLKGTLNGLNREGIKCFYPTFDQILINQALLTNENSSFETGILEKSFEAGKGEHFPIYIKFDISILTGRPQNV